MTWKHVADCLPAELRAQIAKKGAEDFAPAQVREETNVTTMHGDEPATVTTQPATNATSLANGKCEPTHPQAPPQRRVGSHLRLIEGGGGRRQEEGTSAAFRASGEGGATRAQTELRLVIG